MLMIFHVQDYVLKLMNISDIQRRLLEKIFAESNSISAKIDRLIWTKRSYEGAIETSTGVVPQGFTPVNLEAARIAGEAIEDLKSIYSNVHKIETATLQEFVEKNNHDLDDKIKMLKETFGNDISVEKVINNDFGRTKYFEQGYYPILILFNRFNGFKLETEEQRKQRMQRVLKN